MPMPRFHSYDHDMTGLFEMTAGPIMAWISMDMGWGTVVGFRMEGLATTVVIPDKKDILMAKHIKDIPAVRLANRLAPKEFEKLWNVETDKYLFPKRVGKLKMDWPGLTPDVPLGILADWLQENGHERAAEILRKSEGNR